MRTPSTTAELSQMSDDDFKALILAFPNGKDWEHSEAFRYAATRLARLQGLRVHERLTVECQQQIIDRPDMQIKLH